ncbi:histidine kinase [Microbacterium sp. STN6]|uniref:sensor histidine kinase n=1 Tax=Microbacterium sp. STN6 TaxID=2995588 RepID=UPI002260F892|nr:histidine kinase [Microbacterium sp. STN6]MCX7522109.1 histidine kinase [Microbacterium sp. STN6]
MHERIVALWRLRVAGFAAPDIALAALMLVVAVLSVLTGNPDEGPVRVTLPVAVVTALALLWRGREPFIAVALALLAGLTQSVLAQPPGSLWSLLVYGVITYSAAAVYAEGKAAVAGVAMVAGMMIEERVRDGVDYLFIVLLFGGLWLLGRASRLWRSRVRHAEQHQHDVARIAVAEERVRIARELHDVVAHSLSVIAVQSDAAAAALDARPELARAPLTAIRASARGSLAEIRHMLDLLRTDDDVAHPLPGLAALDALIDSARDAGLQLEVSVGHIEPLPATVEAAVFRIVQESLTNVVKHAGPAPTRILIARAGGTLTLEVSNGAGTMRSRVGPRGYGLIGMAERVAAVRGSLESGPSADGGFRVNVRIPLERDA